MAELPTTTEMIPFANSLAAQAETYDRFSPLPSADSIKRNYLFGIPFEDENGNDITANIINHHIDVAKSRFEQKFDQPLLKRRFVEPHDYKIQDYNKFGYIQLFRFPVVEVTQVQLQFIKQTTLIDLPAEWIRVSNTTGQMQIVPNTAAISQFVISGSGDLPHIFGAKSYFPQLIYVNYVAGFETDKVPYIIGHWIGLHAAIQLLRIAGDIILGPGVSNTSIGLGGLSQSIGTTKTRGGAFDGRIQAYKEELLELDKEIRRFYKAVKLTTV